MQISPSSLKLKPLSLNKKYKGTRYTLGFPTGRDSATFRDNRTEVSFLSRDKGTTGQTKNLTKGWDGPGQPKSGTGRGTKRDRAEKDVLKRANDVLKQKMVF